MAPGSCSRRNAPPRSRLGTAIQMLLGTPPNKGLPHRAMHEVQFPPQFPPSTPRKTFRRWQSSAWIPTFKLKPIALNLQATEKVFEKCKDHVDNAGAFGTNHAPFAASFLCGKISFRWHRYKRRKNQAVEDNLPWVEFKAFLRRSISDLRAFADTFWSRRSLQLGVSPHLQLIFIEFDTDGAPEESNLIRFFWKRLKPLVKA